MRSFLSRRANLFAILVAGALFFTALGFFVATGVDEPIRSEAQTLWTESGGGVDDGVAGGPDFAPIAEKLGPTVVRIVVEGPVPSGETLPSPDGGPPETLPPDHPDVPSEGSGVIINEDGFILTNQHVVEGATDIVVNFSDGRKYEAKVLGSDARDDLALIKIEPEGKLPVAPLGDSDQIQAGQWVMAMGNPLGFEYSVTVGVISGTERSLPSSNFGDFIQTDAAIYPGNSGGPLVNLAGEVIGINTAVIPDTNLGFAVPINTAKQILPQLQTRGKVVRGYLGVSIADVDEASTAPQGVDQGAYVEEVFPDSPAQAAGLQAGDVITAVDGKEVRTKQELTNAVTSTSPGTTVTLNVMRAGNRQEIPVTLGSLPSELE